MNILGILCETNNTRICYSTLAMPWLTFRETQRFSINTKVVLSIPNTPTPKFLHLVKLFLQYPTLPLAVSTWDDFINEIESISDLDRFFVRTLVPSTFVDIVDGVSTIIPSPIYSTMQGSLKYYSLSNVSKININAINNNLIINKAPEQNFSSVDSIVFVNGVACYSTSDDTSLIAHRANLLQNTNNKEVRDVVALDFSTLGSIEKYKLSDCEKVYITGLSTRENTIKNSQYVKSAVSFKSYRKNNISIVFNLPTSAEDGIPILCLAGRIFFPKFDNLELFKNSTGYGVFFTLNRDTLESMISVNLAKQTSTISGTKVKRINIQNFLNDLFVDKLSTNIDINNDCTIPFVAMLKTEHTLYLQETKNISVFEPGTIRFPKKSNGLLINKVTRDLFDYTKLNYDSETIVTVSENYRKYLDIKTAPISYTNNKIGFGWHNYNESDIHNPFCNKNLLLGLENLVLLDIGWDDYRTDEDEDDNGEDPNAEVPFGKLDLIQSNKQYKIYKINKNLNIYLEPIDIRLIKPENSTAIIIIKENDNAAGIYYFSSGTSIERIWIKNSNPNFKIMYNNILQCWTIVDPDNKIKYQSSLGVSADIEDDTNTDPIYTDPWSKEVFWFMPINRT